MQPDEKTIPSDFICPISHSLMEDPVLTSDGFSFDKSSIQEWFNRGNKTNPLTGLTLTNTDLLPNRPLRNLITEYIQKNPNGKRKIIQNFSQEIQIWKAAFELAKKNFLGSVKMYENGYYFGQSKKGLRDGKGVYIWLDGNRYQGEWKEDLKHGTGIYFWVNGQRYEGEFKSDQRHGKGIAYYLQNEKYEGEWVEDKREGMGTFFYSNGSKYEGLWEKDEKNGKGKKFQKNTEEGVEEEWKEGSLSKRKSNLCCIF